MYVLVNSYQSFAVLYVEMFSSLHIQARKMAGKIVKELAENEVYLRESQ